MEDTLNPTLAGYVADMNSRDNESLLLRFTPEAVVVDEEETYRGPEGIRAWLEKVQAAFEFTVEPLGVEAQGDQTVVTCRTTGNFPGSPVDLRHFLTLEGDRIAALTIRP